MVQRCTLSARFVLQEGFNFAHFGPVAKVIAVRLRPGSFNV